MKYNSFKYQSLIDATIASRSIVLKYFKTKQEIEVKEDNSPLTKADIEINELLSLAIVKNYPNAGILSEENSFEENSDAFENDEVFILDPIDGTSSFVHGSKEFSVNIGLKIKDKIVMGIIYSPIDDALYYAEEGVLFKIENASQDNRKITEVALQNNENKDEVMVITTRRKEELTRIKDVLSHLPKKINFISFSSSLKFCYLSEGRADLYYRTAKIKLWDVAAGFAIVTAAGFKVSDHEGRDLMEKILHKDYVKTMQKDCFGIDAFVIKKSNQVL